MKTLLKTEKPLLLRRGTDSVKKTPLCVILLFPAQFVNEVFEKCSQLISGIVFGITGSIVMVLGDPVLVLAFVSIAYLIIFREEELQDCFLLEFLGLCFGSIGLHYTAWHFCFFRGQGDQFFAL
ncbi:hypothetical protein CMV_020699 [Castanea mollissima]|uniref:Uncharacterized protein n=1 Tax=Castanea mollissima TaxID=60419 RepID=A0A8J4VMF1_9ROSI|nr:hypothetical protein CMV_020699 [Castanea mollissima]